MSHPPHLPPQACSMRGHYRRQTILWLSLIVGFTLLAGVAGSLLTIAWIAPDITSGPAAQIFFGSKKIVEDTVPPPTFVTGARERIITLYDRARRLSRDVYPVEARVGQVVAVSSDGWGVGFLSVTPAVPSNQWEGVDQNGAVYVLERVVPDPTTGLTYIKFSGNGFRVVSFAAPKTEKVRAWGALARAWTVVEYASVAGVNGMGSVPAASLFLPQSSSDMQPGTLLFGEDGALLGIGVNENQIVPSWLIKLQLPTVLEAGRVEYGSVPWVGRAVEGVMIGGQFERLNGWYVEKGMATTSLEAVKTGDVIRAIEGRPFDATRLAQDILEAPDVFSVTVWRGGEEKEIVVRKDLQESKKTKKQEN